MSGHAEDPSNHDRESGVAVDVPGEPSRSRPGLEGTGRIGSEVRLRRTGSSDPAPALQWCRDGVAIPGATGASYRHVDGHAAFPVMVGRVFGAAAHALLPRSDQWLDRGQAAP